jgi:ankyrin repeat protein
MLEGVLQEIQASTESPQKPMLGDKDAVQMLFDGVIRMNIRDSAGSTPLHIAASRRSQMTPSGDAASLAVHALVTLGAAIDAKNSQGKTPLLVAVDYGRYAIAQKLLELGANIEEPDFDGHRPLILAVGRGNPSLVQLLLANGAYTGTVQVKQKSATPLHWAAEAGSNSIVQEILGKGADVNAQDFLDQTPLHRAVIKEHLDVANTLILAGANVGATDTTQRTALHHAVAKSSVPLVKLLLDHGANPDVEDYWFDSPRREAKRANVVGMVNAFAKADITRRERVGKRDPRQYSYDDYPGEEYFTEASESYL